MSIDTRMYDVRLSDAKWDRIVFQLEHWLLSPGSSDAARLRGYLRVKAWRDCDGLRERLHALKVAAKLPLRAFRGSRLAVAEYGTALMAREGVSKRRQMMHLMWLWLRHGIHPEVYYSFRLHRPGQLNRAPAFLQGTEAKIYRLVNLRMARDEAELMDDKGRFEQWLLDNNLPTSRTVITLVDGDVIPPGLNGRGLPRCDLFSKPNNSFQGMGTQKWTLDGDCWIGPDGPVDEEMLLQSLRARSRGGDLLVQERLRNHPSIAPIAPNALSTVRVLTLRGLDGAVRVVLSVCKIPTGDSSTDHMRCGGLAAPIDLASGRLGQAVRKSKESFIASCERHPDTGATFEGFQLPYWQETLHLALRAHGHLRDLACVGWDIAILDSGPIIIEGNDNPGHTSSQLPTGVAIGETDIAATLHAHLRRSFGIRTPGSAAG